MPTNVGHVSVPITANLPPFAQGLAQARAMAQKFENQATRNMAKVAMATNGATAAASKVATGMTGAAAAAGKMATGMGTATVAAGGLARSLGSLSALLGPLSLGFATVFGVKTIADFGHAMAAVKAVTKATGDEFDRMRNLARELGATTEFTAAQAAEGMRFLGMAGFKTAAILETMPAMLDLATAASLDLGRAADITSNIMTGFGLAASEAGAVADVMSKLANNANTNIEQLGTAMKFVGPVASAMGKDIGETAAAIGALSDAGLQGTMAGTGLRRVLSGLANPTKEAQKVLEGMGLSLQAVNPAAKSTVDIVRNLASAGLTAADALTIFGDRGGPAILALIANEPKLRFLTDALKDARGEASQTAKTMRDELTGDFKAATSAVQDFFLTLGKAGAADALRSAVQGVTEAVRGMSGAIDTVLGIAAGAATLGMIKLAGAIRGAATAMAAFTLALATNPLGLIAVAVSAAVGALVTFRNETVNIRGLTTTVGRIVGAAWDTVTLSVGGTIDAVGFLASALGKVATLDFSGAMRAAEQAAAAAAIAALKVQQAWRDIATAPAAANRMGFGGGLAAFGLTGSGLPSLPVGDAEGGGMGLGDAMGGDLMKRLDSFRESLMTVEEAENASHQRRLEMLAQFRNAQVISAEEAAQALERINGVHSGNMLQMLQDAQRQEIAMRQQTVNLAVGLLDQFAGESKTAAIAAIALNKGVGIANTLISTAQAAAAALAPPPLGLGPVFGAPVAASTWAYGSAQAALIAGTGIAQALQTSRTRLATPAAPSVPSTPSSSSSPASSVDEIAGPRQTIHVTLNGDTFNREQVRKLIEGFNDAIRDGARLVVN